MFKSGQTLLKWVFTVLLLFVWIIPAWGVVYKWRDEKDITHFTDNLTKVPKAFREKPFIKNLLPRKIKSEPKKKNTQSKRIEAIKKR